LDTSKYITEETYYELTRRTPIDLGDTLYSTVGSYGIAVPVDTAERFCFQRHIAILKPNRDKVLPFFLTAFMNTPFIRHQADAAARGLAQKTVNLGDIKRFVGIQPPLSAQHAFVERVRDIQAI
jgi:type I restriction enzyme S subunit